MPVFFILYYFKIENNFLIRFKYLYGYFGYNIDSDIGFAGFSVGLPDFCAKKVERGVRWSGYGFAS